MVSIILVMSKVFGGVGGLINFVCMDLCCGCCVFFRVISINSIFLVIKLGSVWLSDVCSSEDRLFFVFYSAREPHEKLKGVIECYVLRMSLGGAWREACGGMLSEGRIRLYVVGSCSFFPCLSISCSLFPCGWDVIWLCVTSFILLQAYSCYG